MSALDELGRRLDENHQAVRLRPATNCVSCQTTTQDDRHTPTGEEQERAEAFLRLFAQLSKPWDTA